MLVGRLRPVQPLVTMRLAPIDGFQCCLGAPSELLGGLKSMDSSAVWAPCWWPRWSRAGAMLTRRLNVHQLQPIYEQADKGKALSAGQSCGPIRSIEQLAMRIGNEQ